MVPDLISSSSHTKSHHYHQFIRNTMHSLGSDILSNPDQFQDESNNFYQRIVQNISERDFKNLLRQNDFNQLQVSLSGRAKFVYDGDKKCILVIGNELSQVNTAYQLLSQMLGFSSQNESSGSLDGSRDQLINVPKHPWDVPSSAKAEFHDALVPQSSLPSELGNETQPNNNWVQNCSSMQQQQQQYLMGTHLPISRTVSDSYGQHKPLSHHQNRRSNNIKTSNFASPRNKRESEDSSYDSDHDNPHDHPMGPLKLPYVQVVSRSHDDVSRTPSETLAAEFAEHVTLRTHTSRSSRETSPCTMITNIYTKEESSAAADSSEIAALIRNPSYNSKVEFALKLGYSETLLQKTLLKLGVDAEENQILEELIRLQNAKPGKDHSKVSSPQLSYGMEGGGMSIATQSPASSSANLLDYKEYPKDDLLPIVIDGSNVAMSHGNKDVFSCKGIRICVDWFRNRGHKLITVFVPMWRKESSKPETPIKDQALLLELEKEQLLHFTPSRQVSGKRLVCHDDRYILNHAADIGAIVVSNDNYRDLINEKPEYKKVIEERILMYSFVHDKFMPPDDPLGRNGPTLDQFLRKRANFNEQTPCPYGKKCTYGNKCKFYHAERGNQPQKSITDKLKENSYQKINEVRAREHSRDSSPGDPLTRTMSMQPLQRNSDGNLFAQEDKKSLYRTKSTFPRVNTEMNNNSVQQLNLNAPALQQYWPHSAVNHSLSLNQTTLMLDPNQQQQQQQGQQQSLWSSVGSGISGINLSQFPDTSQPPPPPRGPWGNPITSDEDNNTNFGHQKLRRQLTLNPNFDPRIHHRNSYPFPPPTDIPPPTSHFGGHQKLMEAASGGNELFHHSTVTRNLSAPEQISTTSFSLTPTFSLCTSSAGSAQHHQQQQQQHQEAMNRHTQLHRMSSTSDTHLHKTLSEELNVGISLDKSAAEPKAVSPLIGSSDGVWETSRVQPSESSNPSMLVPGTGAPKDRSKLYYHLAQLFPEDQVLLAMRALPEETDAQKICTYIICMNNQQQQQ